MHLAWFEVQKGAMQEMRGCQMLALTGKLSLLPLDNVSGMYTFLSRYFWSVDL